MFRRHWFKFVNWVDNHIVYRLFYWRFSRKFAENPRLRKAFIEHMQLWEHAREAEIVKRRSTLQLVKQDSDSSPEKP